MSDHQLTEMIERYLNGEMSQEELSRFEQLRQENAEIDSRISEHRQFVGMLKHYGERLELEQRLNDIHADIDVHSLVEDVTIHPAWIVQMWRHHHSKISVAASVAILAILATMFFTGYLSNNDRNHITQLKLKIDKLEGKVDHFSSIKTGGHPGNVAPNVPNIASAFGGTGFAVTSNGYIVTNYHVVKDADSVHVQNADGQEFIAKIVYSEPQYDLAFLKIVDPAFESLGSLPYTFKKGKSDLGEDVWNYGYPGSTEHYGSGSISAPNGINGDSTEYQVSIPVNPGASGSPLIDGKGNIVGVINMKQAQIEGAHFAVKSSYLLTAIQNMPSDSLRNKLNLNNRNTLAGLSRPQQIKRLKNYVFKVKAFD